MNPLFGVYTMFSAPWPMATEPFTPCVTAVMVSVFGGATLSLESTSSTFAELFGRTVVKSGFAFVGFLLNIGIDAR